MVRENEGETEGCSQQWVECWLLAIVDSNNGQAINQKDPRVRMGRGADCLRCWAGNPVTLQAARLQVGTGNARERKKRRPGGEVVGERTWRKRVWVQPRGQRAEGVSQSVIQ